MILLWEISRQKTLVGNIYANMVCKLTVNCQSLLRLHPDKFICCRQCKNSYNFDAENSSNANALFNICISFCWNDTLSVYTDTS